MLERNQLLSEERAQAVAQFLEAYGIATDRMETVGYVACQSPSPRMTPPRDARAIGARKLEIIQ